MDSINLHNKRFQLISNQQGLSSTATIFHYYQKDQIITGHYQGGAIIEGNMVGKQISSHQIELLFQCLTDQGELKAGKSYGTLRQNENGAVEIHFDWFWLDDDNNGGQSAYVEILEV